MTRPSTPLITVAMPVRDCASTIEPALRSILAQDCGDFEVLVVDDGSADNTADLVSAFGDPRIVVLRSPASQGVGAQLNRCLDLARGEFFARMDGDDIAYPNRLSRQLQYLREHPEVDLVGAQMLVFASDGSPIGKRPGRAVVVSRAVPALRSIPVGHPTFFGRLAWFRKYRYDAASTHFQDQQLLARAAASSTIAVIPDVLLGYREDALRWRKQVQYRLGYVRSVRALGSTLGAWKASALATAQVMKLAFDGVAIASGLQHRLLANRASTLAVDEIDEWTRVWHSVRA